MTTPRVILLCGGVGGAKVALGLDRLLPPGDLAIIVNTGDDFDHLGLRICPDLDTVLYTLAGVVHPEQGWGRADETFTMLDELVRCSRLVPVGRSGSGVASAAQPALASR
jgi:LPPG:FO 2-phospho-L-lactate transferase